MTRPAARVAALLVGAVLLVGCSDDVDPEPDRTPDPAEPTTSAPTGPVLAADDLASRVEDEYADAEDGSVECTGDLALEVGATQDCTASADAKPVGVRLTVTEVDGDDATLGFTPFLSGERVAATVAETLEAQGYTGAAGECDAVLLGEVGETTSCAMTTDDFETTVVATVTGVEGLTVDFSFEN